MSEVQRTKVGARGRVTIPVAVQQAAGIKEGDVVIVRATAPGVVTVETRQAVINRVREGVTTPSEAQDAVTELRSLRDGQDNDE